MNRYEITLYETIQKTLIYEVNARGEKEAKRIAKRLYKYEEPDEQWVTGYCISEDAIALLVEKDITVEPDDE
jgi:hypothetical protein